MKNIKGDLTGGMTAAIVALPLALACGVQSGLGAISGLYGAIVLSFLASILGGTPALISGPTGPITVISTMIVIGQITAHNSLELALPYILLVFFYLAFFNASSGSCVSATLSIIFPTRLSPAS